jgi:hypothetical protein
MHMLKGLSTSDSSKSGSTVMSLFVTGRPQMRDFVNSHPAIGASSPPSLTLEASTDDIAAYINYRLGSDTKVKMDAEFKKEIVKEIIATSKGMLVNPQNIRLHCG